MSGGGPRRSGRLGAFVSFGEVWVFTGTLCAELLLGNVRSLKEKRSVVRPLVAEVQRRFAVSVAETDHHDLYRRTQIGVAVVSGEGRHCRDVLDAVERMLVERPEVELLEVRRQVFADGDE
jgi:uncharacterized protein YlxP (DUF503 family)